MIPEETIQQVCVAIEAETHTITWEEAPLQVRLASIRRCIEKWTGESQEPEAAKKTKQRKPRGPNKAKETKKPLTQHAGISAHHLGPSDTF